MAKAGANITQERAARRFAQMAALERELADIDDELGNAQQQVKDLKLERDGLIARLRKAAKDEGELPLFAGEE